jgi:hypothetical protein
MKKLILSNKQFNSLYKSIIKEMKAYHGSRSSFGKFSTEFLSTGEGSQAYGWGIYVTQDLNTAKFYCEASFSTRELCIFGKPIKEFSKEELERLGEGYVSLRFFYGMCTEKTTAAVRQLASDCLHEDKFSIDGLQSRINYYRENGMYVDDDAIERLEYLKKRLKHAEILNKWLKNKDFYQSLYKGNSYLYTVEIPDDNGSNYLQWDKKYSLEYIKELASMLRKAGFERCAHAGYFYQLICDYDSYFGGDVTGKIIYQTLLECIGHIEDGGDKTASLLLNKCGIDGNKVPIGFTHGANVEGFNYVIFDENKIKILKSEENNIS